MTNVVYELLDSLEHDIDKSVTLLSVYSLMSKKKLKNSILNIYHSISPELHNAKEHLKQISEDNVFSLLTQFDYIVENSRCIWGVVIIKKADMLNIIDKMYSAFPDNIREARSIQ